MKNTHLFATILRQSSIAPPTKLTLSTFSLAIKFPCFSFSLYTSSRLAEGAESAQLIPRHRQGGAPPANFTYRNFSLGDRLELTKNVSVTPFAGYAVDYPPDEADAVVTSIFHPGDRWVMLVAVCRENVLDGSNDDDDSSPGGGLMQPVS